MQKLTHNNFMKARETIFTHSGDITRAWFRYNFESENTSVLKMLVKLSCFGRIER